MEAIKKELNILVKNKFLCFMYFVMPIIVCVFIYNTFKKEVITKLPIGIVDLDKTQLSRDIAFNINASPTIKIINEFNDINHAKDDLSTKKIYALIVIPNKLQKDIKTNNTPSIALYYNTQLVLIGKNIQSAVLQVSSNINAKLNVTKHIVNDKNTLMALGDSIEFIPKIFGLYNENSNYMKFLLTAIIPCLWQLLTLICMISIMAIDNTKYTTINLYKHICIKFIINLLIFFMWWILMMVFFYKLNFPLNGSKYILTLNAIIIIMAYNSIGIFIYSISRTYTRSLSIATVYAAPSLAFVGITYPINNMNEFAVFWGSILPITNYLQVYLQQAHYGIDSIFSLIIISKNIIFLLFALLGLLIYPNKSYND